MKKIILFIALLSALESCSEKKYILDRYSTMRFEDLAVPASARLQTLTSVDFISPTQGYVGGTQGTLLATTDGGESWQDRSRATLGDINKLLFTSPVIGWAGTSSGLYQTTDGGVSWTRKQYSSIHDIQFVNSKVGYAVGTDNTIMRTNDGGANWSFQNAYNWYPRLNLHAISFTSPDSGIAVGTGHAIYQTTNGGTTWARDVYGGLKVMYDVIRYRNGKGVVWVGQSDDLGYSTSTGFEEAFPTQSGTGGPETWPSQHVYPANSFTVYGLAQWQDRIIAVGSYTVIRKHPEYSTHDSPWVQVLGPDATTIRHNYHAADFSDASTFFAVGEGGVISRFHYN